MQNADRRRTKIVCTIGPASESLEILCQLMEAGMDVARLNLSHGNHEEHGQRIVRIRQAAAQTKKNVAILLDTKGPEIRTGGLGEPAVELRVGASFILTTEPTPGTAERVHVTYEGLPQDVKVGTRILIDDGLIEVQVERCTETEVHCRVLHGGTLKPQKGINVPGVLIHLPSLTEKDRSDLAFAAAQKVDFVAASFVRKPHDILEICQILEDHQAGDIDVIAKIETQEGVAQAESILEVADGLMVARGDLGVEIPVEKVPFVQKDLISLCNHRGKPVITATQMLDSMQRNSRPTRAEASDVANAILDGTDAVMLSGETASGLYPVRTVRTMASIALQVEASNCFSVTNARRCADELTKEPEVSITAALSEAVVQTIRRLHGAAILTATESGYAARMMAKHRPGVPIVAITPNEGVIRKLALVWGVSAVWGRHSDTAESMLQAAVSAALSLGYVQQGSLVVVTAGVPLGQSGTTNLCKVHVVGGVLAKGRGIGVNRIVTGPVVAGSNVEQLRAQMTPGAILVVPKTDESMEELFHQAAAIITEACELNSHAAIAGLEQGVPVVVGVEQAVQKLSSEGTLTIDVHRGQIFSGRTRML